MEIKVELLRLNLRQKDIVSELLARGYKATCPEVSAALSGYLKTPKAEMLLNEIENIIKERKEASDAK